MKSNENILFKWLLRKRKYTRSTKKTANVFKFGLLFKLSVWPTKITSSTCISTWSPTVFGAVKIERVVSSKLDQRKWISIWNRYDFILSKSCSRCIIISSTKFINQICNFTINLFHLPRLFEIFGYDNSIIRMKTVRFIWNDKTRSNCLGLFVSTLTFMLTCLLVFIYKSISIVNTFNNE